MVEGVKKMKTKVDSVLKPCDFKTCIIYKVVSKGTVGIYKNPDGTFTIEHSDLYHVYEQQTFKNYKTAKREYACYH